MDSSKLVVILGASNVARSRAALAQSVREALGDDVELCIAAGSGRGYAADTRRFGRALPSIARASIWRSAERRDPGRAAFALVTDVGNDLLLGCSVEQTLGAVRGCLDELRALGSRSVLTGLPLASLPRLGRSRYWLTTRILRLHRAPRFEALLEHAVELDTELECLARTKAVSFVRPSSEWYGVDPIHIRRSKRLVAWRALTSHWIETSGTNANP